MGRRHLVAVVGDGSATAGDPAWVAAEELGERLVDAGFRVMTGGLGGVMEAACRGARRSRAYRPGDTVGVLPDDDPWAANDFVDVALPTGLGHLRNGLVARADALVAVGGGAGTLSEMALAWVLRRLVVALRVEGWSGRLAGAAVDPRPRFPAIPDDRVFAAATAHEAAAIVTARLPAYLAARGGRPLGS
ncbi:MAG TPA: hypothetical protein VFR85_16875 [Anaeromyxobacteraceae bacterium]|nr:hypothetical protein [Anaeromyxobacteraceae bacterium]